MEVAGAWVVARRAIIPAVASLGSSHDECSCPGAAVAALGENASDGAPVLMGVSGSDRNTAIAMVSGAAAELTAEERVPFTCGTGAGAANLQERCDSP